jgi:type III secretion protein T
MAEPALQELKMFLYSLALGLPRLLAIFALLPIFARGVLPGILRNAIAGALLLPVAMYLMPAVQAAPPEGAALIGIIVKEAFIGLLIGYMLVIPFWALEAVGFLIDNQRGASIAATINPLTGHDSSPLGILFNQAFIVFFFAAGGFVLLLDVVYESYRVWNVLDWAPALRIEATAGVLAMLDKMVRMGLLLAAPVMVAMFLAEVGLALVSRFAPQLQVFFLAMPIKSALAMLMLGVYAATLFDYARGYIDAMRDTVPQVRELVR